MATESGRGNAQAELLPMAVYYDQYVKACHTMKVEPLKLTSHLRRVTKQTIEEMDIRMRRRKDVGKACKICTTYDLLVHEATSHALRAQLKRMKGNHMAFQVFIS